MQVTEQGWKILDAVDRFLYEFRRWSVTNADYLDGAISDALDHLVGFTEAIDGFRSLVGEIAALNDATQALDREGGVLQLASDAGLRFVNAVERLEAVRNRKDRTPKRRIESFRELSRQGVSLDQIARMYGLVDLDGRERSDLVEREQETPGSVLKDGLVRRDIEGWEFPAAYPEPRWSPRQNIDDEPQPLNTEWKKGPETSYDLFLLSIPGKNASPLSLAQAAKMLGREADDVGQEWEEFERARRVRERIADLEELDRLRRAPEPYAEAEPEEFGDEYSGMERDALRELCRERGIGVQGNLSKDKLILKLRTLDSMSAAN